MGWRQMEAVALPGDAGLTSARLAAAVGRLGELSAHEQQLAIEVATTGESDDQIALAHGRSSQTISNTLSEMYHKLGINRETYDRPRIVLVRVIWAAGLVGREWQHGHGGRDRGE